MKDDLTKNYYETHADEYFHATYAVDLQPLWEKLSKRLEKGDYILDLGSGSGRALRYFADRGLRSSPIAPVLLTGQGRRKGSSAPMGIIRPTPQDRGRAPYLSEPGLCGFREGATCVLRGTQ
jgi:SAM-dependent methyltransferase